MTPGVPSSDWGPAPHGRIGRTKVLILWYTAGGTFTWSKGVGCTMMPERGLAVPWGPKLS